MERHELTYKLVDLKIESKALDQIYFMSSVFQEHSHCYDKRKKNKIKIAKIYLFLLSPLPSQDATPPPLPKLFSRRKLLKIFFMDTWVSGQRVSKLAEWQS